MVTRETKKKTTLRTTGAVSAGPPTLKTIAARLGLGVTTVSRALKDGPELSIKTRRSVQETARALGYRPNRAGLRLRTGKNNVISLVLDTEEQIGSFVSEMIFGITEALADTSVHLTITPYSRLDDPMKPIRYLVETGSVDGIIISRIEPQDERIRYMLEQGMPFAAHGRTAGDLQHPYYDFDNEAFTRLAVDRLAELGRRRIALLAPPKDLSFHKHMRQGFLKALGKYGLEEVPFDGVTNDNTIWQIKAAANALFSRADHPDGIINCSGGSSGTGGSTFAIASGIDEAGLVIGRDVDLVTKQLFRRLPALRQDMHIVYEDVRNAGLQLGTLLLDAMAGRPVSQLQRLVIPNEVVLVTPDMC